MSQAKTPQPITDDLSPIADALLKHINTWEGKPCTFYLTLEKDGTSAAMQPLPGAHKERSYINGSYIGNFPFALYLRCGGDDTKSRLDAMAALNRASAWLSSAPLPIISADIIAQKFEMTTLPAQTAVYEDLTEDYRAVFQFTFKKSL